MAANLKTKYLSFPATTKKNDAYLIEMRIFRIRVTA